VHLLANNPDVQRRLRAEIIDVMRHDEQTVTAPAAAADISRFKYLHCVIKEAMR